MKYAVLKLSGSYRETGPAISSLLSARSERQFRFDHFLIRVEHILSSRKISTVLIDCAQDFHTMLAGGAEAVREQLERLADSGRKTIFYAAEYSPLQLYLASACTHRMIHPLGTLSFLGLSRSFLFFKPAADKLRIESTILRRGKYKSAGDRFRTDRMDPFNREQYERYLHEAVREMGEKITAGMKKTQADLDELTAGRMLSAEEALEEGWVHEIRTSDQLHREWKRQKHRNRSVKKVGRSYGRGRKKIAVLVFEGAIIDGKSKRHPILGQAVGAESFVPHVHKLADDSSVKGVVLRVNSGGGSAAASEDIRNALEELREKKPLVVSMSEAAASGGYWISCGAERIFAHADTL
ncbi:MAG: S49 family peptidase, partial [Spirochaetota bacterium]|nr:S49 family peptidase [Spirochaetota bacterium]